MERNKNNYVLGLDVGVTSVGWGIIDNEGDVIDAGVRLFEEATPAKNLKRRERRGARRVKRRRQQRVKEMRRLLERHGVTSKDFRPLPNPYDIRVKGLSHKLTDEKLATALLHIVKRRGSTLDVEDVPEKEADEEKRAKETLAENTRELNEKQKHVCEIQRERLGERGHVRGEDNIFKTEDYLREAKAILDNQDVKEEFKEKALELIERKRHYSEGPGSKDSPTPYGRFRYDEDRNVIEVNLIEEMRGKCSIYPDELRAPLMSFSAEIFNFLNDLNNLTLPGEQKKLTPEQKQEIIGIIRKKGYLSPKNKPKEAIAKILDVDPDLISGFRIDEKEKPLLTEFKGYKKLLKVMKEHDSAPLADDRILDRIAEILTSYKLGSERKEKLQELGLDTALADDLSQVKGFENYHSLSLKAIYEINEEMLKTDKNQMQIITENNMVKKEVPERLTLNEDAILSPVAKRAHREALRVVEALMDKYGDFEKIVVETTRAKNTKEERDREKEIQKRNRQKKEEVKELVAGKYGEDFAERVSKGTRALKLRLYKEQEGKCAYTGNPLRLDAIVEGQDPYEIDHIVPYSVSLDDSHNNKVLCESKANKRKGDRIPFSYFKSGDAYGAITSWDKFKEIVQSNKNYHPKKKEMLLKEEDITKFEALEEFTQRNLVDTSYAVRTLMTTMRDYFKGHEIPTKVFTIRGKVTSLFRNIGATEYMKDHPHLDKNPLIKDREVYRHHAIDALIAARLSEQPLVRELMSIERSQRMDKETGEIFYKKTPKEDSGLIRFVKKLAEWEEDDFKYSWKVDKKPNRAFSDETIYSTRKTDEGEFVVKKYKDIYDLENKKLEKIFETEGGKSLLVYRHDPETFKRLKGIFEQYKHEKRPFGAYREEHGPIRKYAKNGQGPIVRSLKYLEDRLGSHVDVTDKYDTDDKRVVILQISPYRTDFYRNPDGSIKFVTIRYADMNPIDDESFYIEEDLYERKKRDKKIDEHAEFIASFNRNEVIELVSKEKESIKRERYRFIGTNNDKTNQIEVKSIEEKDKKPRVMKTVGRKTQDVIKYAVSPIGEMKKVENESLKLRV